MHFIKHTLPVLLRVVIHVIATVLLPFGLLIHGLKNFPQSFVFLFLSVCIFIIILFGLIRSIKDLKNSLNRQPSAKLWFLGLVSNNNEVKTENNFSFDDGGNSNQELKFDNKQEEQQQSKPPTSPDEMYKLFGVDALAIHIGSNLIDISDPEKNGNLIEKIGILRQSMTLTFGYILPPIRVCDTSSAEPNEYHIVIRGNTVFSSEIYPQRYLILKSHWHEKFPEPPQDSLEGYLVNLRQPVYWVQKEYLDELLQSENWNRSYLDAVDVLLYELGEVVFQYLDQLFTKADVRKIVDEVRKMDFDLVENMVSGRLSISKLRKILINLLIEKVSIRDIHYIFECIEDLEEDTKNINLISEKLRLCLARQISAKHASNKTITAVHLSTELENNLNELICSKMNLNLTSSQAKHLIELIKNEFRPEQTPIVICSPIIRFALSKKLREEWFFISVIADTEITKEYNLEIVKSLQPSDLI